MKQFNLEEYLAHPERKVVTRDGKPVRIVCTDRKELRGRIITESSVSFVLQEKQCITYYADDTALHNTDSNLDLFFAPNKNEGWVNIYKDFDSRILGKYIYRSEADAVSVSQEEGKDYIATVKITWEE